LLQQFNSSTFSVLFCFAKKRTKKGDPKTMYSPFSEGASIELLYYLVNNICSLIGL